MPGSLSHLANRFVDVLLAVPLTPSETEAVRYWLGEALFECFSHQSTADQRHSYHSALSIIAQGPTHSDVVLAALLHDVGKSDSRLGVIARSVVTAMIALRVPLKGRAASYRDHGPIGAALLDSLEAPELAIQYAEFHQGDRPASIPAETWALLKASDHPPKVRAIVSARIR